MYDCPEAAYHRAEPLEQRVFWFLAERYLFKPDELIKTLNRFIESERATDPGPQIAALTAQIKGLEDRRDRYVEAYAGGVIKTVDDLAAKTAVIDRQIDSARAEIRGLQDRLGHIQRLEAAASDAETLAAIIHVRSRLDDEEMGRHFLRRPTATGQAVQGRDGRTGMDRWSYRIANAEEIAAMSPFCRGRRSRVASCSSRI
jgi:hypothetical protein